MARIPIGLQLYSVREDCARDLDFVLAEVARMGYAGVEFAGYYGRTAEDLRATLDSLGLVCCGTHTSLDSILGDSLATTISFNKALGNKFLIVPGLPEERRSSRAAWLETAALFAESARTAGEQGMLVGYHNHSIEFTPLDGEMPWDTFFSNTPKSVVMQLDTGNMLHGGAEPEPYLARYPGRALTVHLKEFSLSNPKALIGEGDVHWSEIFRLCEGGGGVEWYVVEQESYAYPPLECAERCLNNLRAMGK